MGIALLAPLILVAALLVAYAQATLAHSQNTGLIGWLTGKLASLPIIGGLSVKQVLKLDAWITNMLGRHFKQIEARGVAWMVALDSFTRRNAKAALSLGAPVWALAYWLTHVEIGRQAKARDAPIARKAAQGLAASQQALRIAENVAHAKPGTNVNVRVTRVEKVAMPHAEEWAWINNHWLGLKHAISLAAAGVLAPTLPRVKAPAVPWGLTPTRIRRILRGLGVPIGLAAFAVSMAAVFRVTPRCVTSGNIGRAMRGLCRAPTWLLDVFLLTSFEAFTVLDLCQFIAAEVKLAEWLQPLLMDFVDVDEWLIQNCGYQKAPDLTLTPLSLPAGRYGVTLNGPRDVALGLAA